ncbi:MAG: tRNA (5-methylaminomethyl-2-thiouridine)(34)-methyltransferase MnmD [Fibrobacterales bacterium]
MTDRSEYSIEKPDLLLEEGGRLISNSFDDVYYSIKDGLEESRYVFLKHNDLIERWIGVEPFVVTEFGFGTGLNFLATWDLWRKTATAPLHFISMEKFPIGKEDLITILERWGELKELSNEFLKVYPDCAPGKYELYFDDGKVKLTLIFSDVADCLEDIPDEVDAWYLDGFDPKKNPDMWSDSVYEAIGQKSKKGSTIATFTAAGVVKRALRSNNFKLKRVDGFGPKWHMLKGVYQGAEDAEG